MLKNKLLSTFLKNIKSFNLMVALKDFAPFNFKVLLENTQNLIRFKLNKCISILNFPIRTKNKIWAKKIMLNGKTKKLLAQIWIFHPNLVKLKKFFQKINLLLNKNNLLRLERNNRKMLLSWKRLTKRWFKTIETWSLKLTVWKINYQIKIQWFQQWKILNNSNKNILSWNRLTLNRIRSLSN
jgi:hypothetical protein